MREASLVAEIPLGEIRTGTERVPLVGRAVEDHDFDGVVGVKAAVGFDLREGGVSPGGVRGGGSVRASPSWGL